MTISKFGKMIVIGKQSKDGRQLVYKPNINTAVNGVVEVEKQKYGKKE